jgi:hypothetical protein
MTFLSLCLSVLLLSFQTASAFPIAETSLSPVLIIGFVGGFVSRNDQVHSTVQLAAKLRREYPSGVYIQVFENSRGEEAHADLLRLLDTDHDGSLSAEEKRNARIILFGHSWGGGEAVTLSRELQKNGVPVLLTIQVDSISKSGPSGDVIPANVAEAANFYQTDGFLHGETQIRAADPARTQILGNYKFDYKTHPIRCDQYPWYDRFFMRAHIEIECDPNVWDRVETLIRSKLP